MIVTLAVMRTRTIAALALASLILLGASGCGDNAPSKAAPTTEGSPKAVGASQEVQRGVWAVAAEAAVTYVPDTNYRPNPSSPPPSEQQYLRVEWLLRNTSAAAQTVPTDESCFRLVDSSSGTAYAGRFVVTMHTTPPAYLIAQPGATAARTIYYVVPFGVDAWTYRFEC